MDIRTTDSTLVLSGILDESTTKETIARALRSLRETRKSGRIFLDFSAVPFANSSGIGAWLAAFRQVPAPYAYRNMPVWLVMQANSISEFIEGDVTIESFYAPYLDADAKKSLKVLFEIGRDIELKPAYTEKDAIRRDPQGQALIPDFEADEYFDFLIRVLEKRRKAG